MNFEYFYIAISFFLATILAFVFVGLSYFLVYQEVDIEKVSAYECGFQPFEDARQKFDIRFYLVAILFLIFDLEIMFLFPWSISLYLIDFFGYWSMIYFLIILTIGFVYEWQKGALEWD